MAKVAGTYTKELLNAFDNDYILMIACYGVNIQEAGRKNAEVARMGLSDDERADINRLVERGVLNDAQLSTLANFFAAGLVALFPDDFGAKAPPLKQLVQ